MANSTQNEELVSSSCDTVLKRKAISELRLRDPKLWDIVTWMKSMFVKDMESGVRKVDFYNYVTGHLGRIGYRDVWHILKIAYPHVDRVRRGRKYMYWGIRHVDDKLEHMTSASLHEGEGPLCADTQKDVGDVSQDKDDEKDVDDSGGEGCGDKVDNNNTNNNHNVSNDKHSINNSNIGSIGNKRNSNNSSSNNNNNNNSVNDDNNNNLDDNSNNNSIQPDNIATKNSSNIAQDVPNPKSDAVSNNTKDDSLIDSITNTSSNDEKHSALSIANALPVVVKSEHLSDNEEETKPQDFLVMEFKEKDVFESFEDYEKSKGMNNKDGRSLTPPPAIFTDHPSPPSPEFKRKDNGELNDERCKTADASFNESHGDQDNQIFSSSLLKPENINKVCIPLIQDAKSQTKKGEVTKATKTGFNPVIVSVESIGSGSTTDHRNPNATKDDKLTDQSQELQTVVVQDRGIQVCENADGNSTQRRMRKRKPKETEYTKDGCANKNEPAILDVVASLKPRKKPRKAADKPKSVLSTPKPTIPLAPKPTTVSSTQQQRLGLTNVVRVPTLPLPSTSRGYTASSTIGGTVASAQGITFLTQALTNATNVNASGAKMTSSTHPVTSRLSDGSFKRNEGPLSRLRHNHLMQYKTGNSSNDNNNQTSIARNLQELTTRPNTSINRPANEQSSDYNRELIRKLLEEHESRIKSAANSKDNDLQVMVDCLSAEVEKERTMRLRLEIELRKVENQLEQERKLNERLATLLMKR